MTTLPKTIGLLGWLVLMLALIVVFVRRKRSGRWKRPRTFPIAITLLVLGVFGFSGLAAFARLARRPTGATWLELFGGGVNLTGHPEVIALRNCATGVQVHGCVAGYSWKCQRRVNPPTVLVQTANFSTFCSPHAGHTTFMRPRSPIFGRLCPI